MADISELTRHAVKVLPEGALERKLAENRPLRVKLGIDPTARDIHVGNATPIARSCDSTARGWRRSTSRTSCA
jgi:tyrosyl-tRNA synthetase